MNILIAINRKYIFPAKVLLRSIAENNSENIEVFLAHSELTGHDAADLERFVSKLPRFSKQKISINFRFLDEALLGRLKRNWNSKWPPEIFFRYFVLYNLPESVDRILYLDADTVVNGSLKSFYEMKLDGCALAATRDIGYFGHVEDVIVPIKKCMGIPDDVTYVNSGVLLFDVKRFTSLYTLDEIINAINGYGEKLSLPDQDLLNVMYQGNIKLLPDFRYNLYSHAQNLSLIKTPTDYEPVIYHYICKRKPWHWQSINKERNKIFWKYAKMNGAHARLYFTAVKRMIFTPVRNVRHYLDTGHSFKYLEGLNYHEHSDCD